MLSVDEAIAIVTRSVPRLGAEIVPVGEAHDRVLAADVVSAVDVPPWDNSAMDGYAVRAVDVTGDETELRLLETVGAGAVARQPVEPGTAVGIMTGAPLPPGADAVVPVEDTDGARQGTVRIRGPVATGAHVRSRGEDVREGAVVLRAGSRLGPGALGVASAIGLPDLSVRRRPRVSILVTGDELVRPGQALQPGQIWSSNDVSLAALVHEAGGIPRACGIARDDLGDTVRRLEDAVVGADLVLTTGGVSVGQYDYVKEAFERLGAPITFWKVRMKPGKPLAVGQVGDVPLFGLPGNPVSCMVNFLQFVRPWMRLALGDPAPFLPVIDAICGEDLRDGPGRARFVRVTLERGPGQWIARPTGSQSSGVLTSMALGQGLLVLGAEAPPPRRGDPVRVQLLDGSLPGGAAPAYGW